MHEMHRDPNSQEQILRVGHFEDERTRDRFSRYNKLAGRLGTSSCESLFSSCFVVHCFWRVLLVFGGAVLPVSGENFEELSVEN